MSKHHYSLIKEIGHGSFGKVFLMRRDTGEYVAVKSVKFVNNNISAIEDAKNEAQLLHGLSHPNIIRCYEHFMNDNSEFCLVLEYADANDLKAFLEKQKQNTIPESTILKLFSQIILGLAYLHSKGIIHRDIKPANIFVFKNGVLKLGDFGISRLLPEEDFATTFVGTPYYMSPEVYGQNYSFPADIWAVGCIVYEMMTHRKAFTGSNRNELKSKIIKGRVTLPKNLPYSKGLIDVCLSMLNPNPYRRPTCEEILALPILSTGLNELNSCLNVQSPMKASRISSPSASKANESEIDSDEKIPQFLKDCPDIGAEVVKQSIIRQRDDTQQLLAVVKQSMIINSKYTNQTKELGVKGVFLPTAPMIKEVNHVTWNITERKLKLIAETKKTLGNKFDIALSFIQENGQNNRDELRAILNMPYLPEREIKMLEVITMLERYEKYS